MELIISNASDKPIYEQISSQIKSAVLAGELEPGSALPSIRALANDLHVSVITTKRAYSDLEALGFIETRQGKGRNSSCSRCTAGIIRDLPWSLTYLSTTI